MTLLWAIILGKSLDGACIGSILNEEQEHGTLRSEYVARPGLEMAPKGFAEVARRMEGEKAMTFALENRPMYTELVKLGWSYDAALEWYLACREQAAMADYLAEEEVEGWVNEVTDWKETHRPFSQLQADDERFGLLK